MKKSEVRKLIRDLIKEEFQLDQAFNVAKPVKEETDEYKQYKRTGTSEMRPYKEGEKLPENVSISEADEQNGCPKVGDMIARNPEDHNDQWLVEEKYFKDNFEEVKEDELDEFAVGDNVKYVREATAGIIDAYGTIKEIKGDEALVDKDQGINPRKDWVKLNKLSKV